MNIISIVIITILALIDVVLAFLLIKSYKLFNNMQATIIMLKTLLDRNDVDGNNKKY